MILSRNTGWPFAHSHISMPIRSGHKATPITTFIIITGCILYLLDVYVFMEHFLHARHCAKHFTSTISFKNLKTWAVFSSLFTDEETVAESSEDLTQSHTVRKWQSWMSGFSCHVLDDLTLPHLI